MDERKLKEVVNRISMKKEMEEEILKNIADNQFNKEQEKGRRPIRWQKKAAVAAAVVVSIGVVGVSANAVRNSFVNQHMEEIPKEELETIVEEIDNQQADAYTYSRELTSEERERMSALHSEYLNGRFPESELTVVSGQEQIDKEILCFASDSAFFNIPNRELTDEELLQILDFNQKRDYALQKRYEEEYADEIAEQAAVEQKEKEEVEEEGGITEEEAVIKAGELLESMFGKTGDEMELNHYLNTAEEAAQMGQKDPFYTVCYSVMGDYYYFSINAKNGRWTEVSHSYDGLFRDEIKAADAESGMEATYKAAEDYLKNKLGITDEYEEVYYSYMKSGDGESVYMNSVNFCFVKEDRTCHIIDCLCDDNSFFRYAYADNYDEYLINQKENDAALFSDSVAQAMDESSGAVSERVVGKLK